MTNLRFLPDVERLVIGLLTDVPCSTTPPADVAAKLPRRTVVKLGGTAAHPKFLDKPQVLVTSFADTRQGAADLAETARVMLFNAWRSQARVAGVGGVHKVVEVSSPVEVRTSGQPDGVHQFVASYQVFTRP